MNKVSLNKIAEELQDEHGIDARTYKRHFELFMKSCGRDPKEFLVNRKYVLTKNEAIIYKEVLRESGQTDGFLYKWLHKKDHEISDQDYLEFYENIESNLMEKAKNCEVALHIVRDFLETIDVSLGYHFTLLVLDIENTFKNLMHVSNTFLYPQQLNKLHDLRNCLNAFYDKTHTESIEYITTLTKTKVHFEASGTIQDYLDEGKCTSTTVLYANRDKHIHAFLQNHRKEKAEIEEVLQIKNIEKYYNMGD